MSYPVSKLSDYLKGSILLICHHNADPDAVFSAYAFKELINRLNLEQKVDILLSKGASSLSGRLLDKFGINVDEEVEFDVYDSIFLLDTASYNQLDKWEVNVRETSKPLVVIDHHSVHPDLNNKASLYIHDEDASSTCEIIAALYKHYNLVPSKKVAEALILGIAFDSKHFTLGSPDTLRTIADLLTQTDDLRSLLQLMDSEPSKSEKIARLKGGQRIQLHEVDGWIIATAEIGAYQASVARGIISLGADVAILAGSEKKQLKVSLRSTDKFFKETGVHLGRDVTLALSYEFEGSGSGHPTAAGFNGAGVVEEVLLKSLDLITEQLSRKSSMKSC